jgi:putative hydrolase of the HAD superfamily
MTENGSRCASLYYQMKLGGMTQAEFCRRAGDVFGVPSADVSSMSDVFLIGIFPGVPNLINELHARGYATACLSNTNDSHWRLMSNPAAACCLPLELLMHRFASHLVGARKPEPAIYAHVERNVGIRGERIVFFDDLAENVAAARSRGWHAHRITSPDHPVTQIREHLRSHGVL